jgi:trk system potassium uptake protein TrkH
VQRSRLTRIGDRIIRRPRLRDILPIVVKVTPRKPPSHLFSSPLMIPISFAVFIAIGGALLLLPIANTTGQMTPPMIAFFTATSAVTVTGHALVNTADYWTSFGQGILFGLMIVGGLGFMTGATFVLILIGQRISLPSRLLMRETMVSDRLGGLVRLLRQVVAMVFLIYLIGIGLLFWRFYGYGYFDGLESLWQSAFHTVSAFNNCGLDITPGSTSLYVYRTDYILLSIIAVLIILGGIGYTVLMELFRGRGVVRRFSLDTKLVLTFSIALLLLGTVVIFLGEFGNEKTLGSLPWGGRVFGAFFQSVVARTAGFSTMDLSHANDLTELFITGLMFIGGAAGSMAGGIKINSFALLLVAVIASIRGRAHAEAFGREIPHVQIYRALAITVLAFILVGTVTLIFAMYEKDIPFPKLLFETVSAFGTVGLSAGITAQLSAMGKILLIIVMFVGRLGPLTLAMLLAPREQAEVYRYMQERVKIG